ncbi:hypothetical protein L873DRAFT_1787723 [Choiromyces venosus 120613-1]|uniref:Uncharacterized protein n=1 Tax=Choiromyces venosus 120613-1 TaxID=1336337 RepID=A0A3N4JYL3_9PEZI|nr:hypothetical protein L873DRAFT_1787723 [Choiromyces venosus 120613-1]
MVNFIPPPVLPELLPPLLAHIPVAFTSPQPPPSLYPLLSPILRQRLRLLGMPSSSNSSVEETWLSLLTWSSTAGPKLSAHLATQDFTPHPASGELELGEIDLKGFQRLDKETIKACVQLPERSIEAIYLWIANDPDGEDDGWRIMELHLLSDSERTEWYPTVGEADEAFYSRSAKPVLPVANPIPSYANDTLRVDNNDDDDYWDMYDRTPARSPMALQKVDQMADDDYYSQYDNTQPVMEPETSSVKSSPEHSRYTNPLTMQHSSSYSPTSVSSTPPTAVSASFLIDKEETLPEVVTHAPRPISPGSPSSAKSSVDKLEEAASLNMQAETGVKQHISTSIKSLYRLSKSVGIAREEFERLLQTEIAFLEMMDEDE